MNSQANSTSWQGACTARRKTIESPRIQATATPRPAFTDGSSQGSQIVRFDEVTVQFDDRSILESVSLEVHVGETIVLLGATASGSHHGVPHRSAPHPAA
jgi:ABC-type molybdenum transport system ATPase subunit/photorepair protein PhrA